MLDPEPDPPIIIKPRYGNAQKKHFVEGDKSRLQQARRKGAVGMVVAVNLLNIDKTYPGTNFIRRRQRL